MRFLDSATSPGALTPHSAGEPDTLPLTWCKKCQANVVPEGKGKCPRCGIFLRQNFVARRHLAYGRERPPDPATLNPETEPPRPVRRVRALNSAREGSWPRPGHSIAHVAIYAALQRPSGTLGSRSSPPPGLITPSGATDRLRVRACAFLGLSRAGQ